MKKFIISLLILVASAMSASVYASSTVYEGTIGDYKIHMVLDEDYNGYYYYDHRPDSRFKLIKTRESYDDCDGVVCFTLQEFVPKNNKNSAEFICTLTEGHESGVGVIIIEGLFRNKMNGKILPFEVLHVYTY